MMWGGGWWIVRVVLMAVCVYLMARMMMGHGSGHSEPASHGESPVKQSARDVLAERFARGEISETEFRERIRVLEHPAS
jgi:putative membrane protein